MRLAFQQATALAHALAAEDLWIYERAHPQIAFRPRLMSDFMLLMDRSAVLRTRALGAFQRHPRLFASLLAMHAGGNFSPIRFASAAATLGLRVAVR
jgi:hypothetical protein